MILGSGGSSKASSFLSSLKSGPAPSSAPASEDMVRPLLARIETLERRIQEMAAKAAESQEEAEGPPQPPTEMMIYLQTRMELLERKLQLAQEEALRANLLLREREEAQRKAQKEVEDLFRSIREQNRAANWDAKLRDEFSNAQKKIMELEARLQEIQLKSIPAEDVLECLNKEEGRAELERRIEEKAKQIPGLGGIPSPASAGAGSTPSVPPKTEGSSFEDSGSMALVLGRVSDLERQLESTQKERDDEKARRILWEKDILAAITKEPGEWKRTGGAELVVNAALENLAETFKQRDALAAEMSSILKQLQQEPPDSPELGALRSRLAMAQDKIQELQAHLDKQMAIVQAWLKEGKR